jgi:hypothetical protein
MLNEDFAEVMEELETTPVIGGAGPLESGVQPGVAGAKTYLKSPEGTHALRADKAGGAIIQQPTGDGAHGKTPTPDEPERGELDKEGTKADESTAKGEKRKPRGGFSIKFSNDGPEAFRAKMVPELMTIFINLDYPEFAIFKDHDDPRFRALANEVAVAEYAIATVNIMVKRGHVDVVDTAADALIEYNRIVNRMGRKIAELMPRWYGLEQNAAEINPA